MLFEIVQGNTIITQSSMSKDEGYFVLEAGNLPLVRVRIPSRLGQIPTQCGRGAQASGIALL